MFAPENGRLEDEFPFGMARFHGRTVSFRECNQSTIQALVCIRPQSSIDIIL